MAKRNDPQLRGTEIQDGIILDDGADMPESVFNEIAERMHELPADTPRLIIDSLPATVDRLAAALADSNRGQGSRLVMEPIDMGGFPERTSNSDITDALTYSMGNLGAPVVSQLVPSVVTRPQGQEPPEPTPTSQVAQSLRNFGQQVGEMSGAMRRVAVASLTLGLNYGMTGEEFRRRVRGRFPEPEDNPNIYTLDLFAGRNIVGGEDTTDGRVRFNTRTGRIEIRSGGEWLEVAGQRPQDETAATRMFAELRERLTERFHRSPNTPQTRAAMCEFIVEFVNGLRPNGAHTGRFSSREINRATMPRYFEPVPVQRTEDGRYQVGDQVIAPCCFDPHIEHSRVITVIHPRRNSELGIGGRAHGDGHLHFDAGGSPLIGVRRTGDTHATLMQARSVQRPEESNADVDIMDFVGSDFGRLEAEITTRLGQAMSAEMLRQTFETSREQASSQDRPPFTIKPEAASRLALKDFGDNDFKITPTKVSVNTHPVIDKMVYEFKLTMFAQSDLHANPAALAKEGGKQFEQFLLTLFESQGLEGKHPEQKAEPARRKIRVEEENTDE